MKRKIILGISLVFCVCSMLNATNRTIPVDVVLMIDKSVSMQETGKFDSLKKWVVNELIEQMLIPGDTIEIYQFYEIPEYLSSIKLGSEQDKQKVIDEIGSISPNGKFTDIGKALDKIANVAKSLRNGNKYKILLLITDLEQDAPLASKYAGKQKKFSNPYLVESRIIKHDKWYEITLDMSIQDRVIKTTQELFDEIKKNKDTERTEANENEALIKANSNNND